LDVEHCYERWCSVDTWHVCEYVLQTSAYLPDVVPELELLDMDAV